MAHLSTHGMDHNYLTYRLSDGSLVKVKLLDTAGQEQYKSLTEGYYKSADCCLLVYDITNKKSFEEIKNYYCQNIKDKCKNTVKVALLGNKADLEDKREVDSKEGSDLASQNDFIFMESSCLKNEKVADAFETLIENTNIDVKKKNIADLKNNNSKNSSWCC